MRSMQSAPELGSAALELLEAARAMVSADFAELILLPRAAGEPVLRAAADRDRNTPLGPAELTQAARVALDVASVSDKTMLLPRGRDPHVLDAYLAEHELSDALVTAIHGDDGLAGMLLVGERLGDVASFSVDDRKLVETLAGHAGVVLENEQVREQLRHQAFHDALTGLPNRVLFTQQVRDALAAG